MKQSRKILACLLLAVLVGTGLSMAVTAQTNPPINMGDVRVINALVGLGAVDVYLDNEIIAYGLLPEQATPYFGVPTGRHVIAVRMANADPLSAPVTDVLIDLAANQSQTAIAYQKRFAEQPAEGTAAGVVPLEQSGAFMVMNDDRSQTQLGKSRLTAAHLSPGTPGRLSIAYTDRASLLHEISLEQPYGAIDVDAGVYQLAVVDAESADLNLIERIGALNFHANTLYMMVIVPDIVPQPNTGSGLSAPPVSPAPRVFAISAPLERPTNGFQMRIIHTAHNTDVLDLYIDERLVAQRMNFGQYTEYLGLNDYSHTVTLRRRDADPNSPPLAAATIRISEENRNQDNWSLLLLNANQQAVNALSLIGASGEGGQSSQIVNTSGGPLVMVLLPDNIAQTQRGAARVRLLHAIDGALDLSLYASDLPGDDATTPVPGPTPTPSPAVLLVQPLVYGAEANEVETGEGLYRNLEFRAGGSTIVYTIPERYLVEGLVYTYVLIGQPAGEPPVQALQLTDFGRGIPQERLYRGVVTSTSEIVNVRDRDNTDSSIQGQITPGTEVEVIGRNQDGSWALIRYTPANQSRPSEGWVLGALVTITRLGDEVNILTLPVVRR